MKNSDLPDFIKECCEEAAKGAGMLIEASVETESEELGVFRVQMMTRPSAPRLIGCGKGFRWAFDPINPEESLGVLRSFLKQTLNVDVCITCKRPL